MEAAEASGQRYFIPCHNGIHCVTLSLQEANETSPNLLSTAVTPVVTNYTVIAGHFFWDIWKLLPEFAANEKRVDNDVSYTSSPSCFVMGRHPVDRAISYYYQVLYCSA